MRKHSPQAELAARLQREQQRRVLLAEQARRHMADFVSYIMPDYIHSPFSREVCGALDVFLEEVVAD